MTSACKNGGRNRVGYARLSIECAVSVDWRINVVASLTSVTCHDPPTPCIHAMEEDGGGQSSREVPSLALDRLFLELHDQLPKESRERFAQLADEVKRLTESSTTKAPVTPSSSTDQAVVRREEEIATAEAKQRSGELQARGRTYGMLSVGIIEI